MSDSSTSTPSKRVTRAGSKLLSPPPSSGPPSLLQTMPGTPRFAAPPSPPTFSSLKKAAAPKKNASTSATNTPSKLQIVASPEMEEVVEVVTVDTKGKGREVVEDEESSSEEEEEDSDESSSSEEDSDEEDAPEDEEAFLASLLAQAYSNAEAKEEEKARLAAGEEVVLQLEETKEVPLPNLTVPSLPTPYLQFTPLGRATLVPRPGPSTSSANTPNATSSSSSSSSTHGPELDNVVLPRPLSKNAAKAERKASTPLAWGALPAIPENRRKDMTREYHALKLRNSLDPKRFYKGQGSNKVVPEVFAIGTLHTPSTRLSLSTLPTQASSRPASIVKELLQDDEAKKYAKRKFGVLQGSRERNGRGMGWKKKKVDF